MTDHTLYTQRLTLRAPHYDDWPAWRAFAQSDRATGAGGPFTHRTAWRQFAAEIGHWQIFGYGMFTVTKTGDDTAIGLIGPWTPDDFPENEIGWMIYEAAEGQGIAYEAANACLDFVFQTLGWHTAVSYIDPDNTRSIALAQRLGAQHDPDAPQPYDDHDVLVFRHPIHKGATP